MRPWLRNTLIAACALFLLIGVSYYWFFLETGVPAGALYVLDIGEVRRLAAATPGDRPIAVEVETVGLFKPPAAFVVAGGGWKLSKLPVYSYRIVFPKTSAIIDTALSKELGGGNLDSFDPAAFARIQAAMGQASLILLTHEHADHIGGLATHPNLAAMQAAAKLTREQIANPAAMLPARFTGRALDGFKPLDYLKYQAVAPGIVLIKAPGHTPGSQMVYVQVAGGSEFLFTGDVAWHFSNIELQRERPRFVTQFTIEEDRAAVFGELGALHRLHESEPRINIVPGHDGVAVQSLIDANLLKSQFASAAASQQD